MAGVESRQFGNCSVTFDDRYAPIYVLRWVGPTNHECAKWGIDLVAAAAAEQIRRGGKGITISDATYVERPAPDVRKYLAERADALTKETKGVLFSSYLVLANPLVRGVSIAVGWLSESARGVKHVGTIEQAIEGALKDLDRAGIARPAGLDARSYSLPRVAKSG